MIDSCVMMADTKVARFPYVDKSEIADKIVEEKSKRKQSSVHYLIQSQ